MDFFVGVYGLTGLSIAGVMHDEFFPANQVLYLTNHEFTSKCQRCADGEKRPKYTNWIRDFVKDFEGKKEHWSFQKAEVSETWSTLNNRD